MELYERYDEVKQRPYLRLDLTIPETRVAQHGLSLWLSEHEHEDRSKMTPAEKQVAFVAGINISDSYPAGAKIRFTTIDSVNVMADAAVRYATHLQRNSGDVTTLELEEAQNLAVALTFAVSPVEELLKEQH